MHLYVPSLLLLTRASVRVPVGAVTNAFTLPPRGTTDRASTVNSVVDSRNTPTTHQPATHDLSCSVAKVGTVHSCLGRNSWLRKVYFYEPQNVYLLISRTHPTNIPYCYYYYYF